MPAPDPADPTDLDDGADLAGRWARFAAQVGGLERIVADAPDPVATADGYRYLLHFLAAGIAVCTELDDTETPDLGRSIDHRMTWGLDNPDCLYGYTRLRGDATYRITGTRGTVRHLELQVNTGHQGDGDFAGWEAVSALGADDLTVGPDGEVEVVLSAEPPEPARPNWLRLDQRASFLLVRQYCSDWEHEEPATLVIERTDAPLPPPHPEPATVAARLDLLGQWLTTGADCWDDLSRGLVGGGPGDVQPFLPPAEASGLKGQAYGMRGFACAPDQAVVLELTPPPARMWGISLCDRWWQSIDFATRQSSLNDSQATLTTDGRFLGVIAHADPGVANWLDPGGHTAGTLALRYLFPADPDHLPALTVRTVPLADLDAALDPATPRCTPAERAATLAARHRAVARRHRRP